MLKLGDFLLQKKKNLKRFTNHWIKGLSTNFPQARPNYSLPFSFPLKFSDIIFIFIKTLLPYRDRRPAILSAKQTREGEAHNDMKSRRLFRSHNSALAAFFLCLCAGKHANAAKLIKKKQSFFSLPLGASWIGIREKKGTARQRESEAVETFNEHANLKELLQFGGSAIMVDIFFMASWQLGVVCRKMLIQTKICQNLMNAFQF